MRRFPHVARRTARPHLPYARRYARALCGDQPAGDTLVVTLLETALDQPELRARLKGGRIELYRALGDLWRSISSGQITALPKGAAEKAAQLRLSRITPLSRQALLLTTVEDFTTEQAAEILGTAPLEVRTLVASALAEIARDTAADVMIIEDEPLIAMQLEDIVKRRATVCATAATRSQACRPSPPAARASCWPISSWPTAVRASMRWTIFRR
jgi:DNA-directed RNA polymerase specialized sigma24 family protein